MMFKKCLLVFSLILNVNSIQGGWTCKDDAECPPFFKCHEAATVTFPFHSPLASFFCSTNFLSLLLLWLTYTEVHAKGDKKDGGHDDHTRLMRRCC